MIFTLLCIKEFVKNFPFVNKNNPSSTEDKEAQEEPHKKATEKTTKEEASIEGPIEGLEKNDNT